jgi:hypothetical protein
MDDTTNDGRMWAALSYGGVFVGLPLGLVPLVQRNDAFALHHAKQALGVQFATFASYLLGFAAALGLFFVTCGMSNFVAIPLLAALMLWPVGQGVHGLILALDGDWTPPLGSFGLGDRLFASVTLLAPPSPASPPSPPPPPPAGA